MDLDFGTFEKKEKNVKWKPSFSTDLRFSQANLLQTISGDLWTLSSPPWLGNCFLQCIKLHVCNLKICPEIQSQYKYSFPLLTENSHRFPKTPTQQGMDGPSVSE